VSKDQLVRLALPMSIIIASIILYMGMTTQYRGCVEGYSHGSGDKMMAQWVCGKP